MSKKMTLKKKGLALMLCLMMGVTALAGCGKEADSSGSGETEEGIEVPEVDGKEKTVGAFTLLVPKGMDADEGDTESEVILSDDDDNTILLQVFDKKEAKNYIKELQEDNEKLKDESFDLNGVTWKGASNKKEYYVWGKVGSQVVLATGDGFKLTDDITLAVLASLEVDEDAEPVSGGGSSSSKAGTFAYHDDLYTVEYSEDYREPGSDEWGDLVYSDGSVSVYITALSDYTWINSTLDDIEDNDYDLEMITTKDGLEGSLYFYEDSWGDYYAQFVLPLEWIYTKDWEDIGAVYIHAYGDDADKVLNDSFRDLCRSVSVNADYITDVSVDSTGGYGEWASYWERGWYGWYIIYDGDGKYEDDISWAYDCLAEFTVDTDGNVEFKLAQEDSGDSDVMDVYLRHYTDGTDMGYLVSEQGMIDIPETDGNAGLNGWVEFEIDEYDFMFDPESDQWTMDDYLTFQVWLYDDDYDSVCVKGFLRPWGADWHDFDNLDPEDFPEIIVDGGPCTYEDMFPFNYSDWYEDRMYDDFPGIHAFSE